MPATDQLRPWQQDSWWLEALINLEEFQATELQHDDYVEPERECDR